MGCLFLTFDTKNAMKCGILCVMFFHAVLGASTFQSDYMTEKCNKQLGERISGRFETSTSLTYDNLMDCYTTITVESGKRILLLYRRFELEDPLLNTCVDAFNAHDGASTAAATLHADPLCGVLTLNNLRNMTSSGNAVTFHFTSDNNGVFRGFDIVYSAFSNPPCSDTEFECANAMCIHGDLRCDDVEQCGDGSDEVGCEDVNNEDDAGGLNIGLIAGCSVAGFVILVIIIIVIYKIYTYYKWNQFIKLNTEDMLNDNHLYSYPKTDKYTVLNVGHRGRRDPDVTPYFDDQELSKDRLKSSRMRKKVEVVVKEEEEETYVEKLKQNLEEYLDEK